MVTGLGAVSSLGNTVEDTWSELIAGKSGAGPITQFDPTGYPVDFACEVQDLDLTSETVDFRAWGPLLRYCAPERLIDQFYIENWQLFAPFKLYGSGDFHHLSALWLRRLNEPFVLISFDNHPDWDVRPPHWCCGTWINRALELPMLQRAAIWGCGNFELNWPGYLFINGKALREQRIEVWPWTERLKPSGRKRWTGITRESWKESFAAFAANGRRIEDGHAAFAGRRRRSV